MKRVLRVCAVCDCVIGEDDMYGFDGLEYLCVDHMYLMDLDLKDVK